MTSFTFFDVETPNRSNSHVCQIGVVRTDEQGREEYSGSFLINPQTHFDDMNVRIHGITEDMVADAPIFSDVWESELRDVFADSVLVAHNAKAVDLRVVSKVLERYNLEPLSAPYICTLMMARKYLPHLTNHKLNTMASYYDIPLRRHHDAMSDTQACAGIFWAMVEEFGMPQPQEFIYSSSWQAPTRSQKKKQAQTLEHLYSILVGVDLDKKVNEDEQQYMQQWWAKNKENIVDFDIRALIGGIADGHLLYGEDTRHHLCNILKERMNSDNVSPETLA
ncbi:MAG: 3'-5' exonuclease [Actinomycetaceae bacterium]|nr:3'-5' exonuclease [Actinomycetaceae bacterium]